jgi:hypothetical protein
MSLPITLSTLIRQISNLTDQELKPVALSNIDPNISRRVELIVAGIRVERFRWNSHYDMSLHHSFRELVSDLHRQFPETSIGEVG